MVAGSALAAPGVSSPSSPPKPGVVEATDLPEGVTLTRIANQDALHAVADRVMRGDVERFVGAVDPLLDVDGRSMVFRWYKVTAEQRAAVQALADQHGVKVSFVDAPYSLPQLQAAQDRLAGARAELKAKGVKVNGVTPHARESGNFVVDITRADKNRLTLEDAKTILEQVAGISIDITEDKSQFVPYPLFLPAEDAEG